MEKITKILKIFLIIGVIAGAVFTAKYFINSNTKVKEAFRLATTKVPESFTELYFEDHINLPSTIAKDKKYDFIFTIHNLENKKMTYQLEVSLETSGKKTVIDKKTIELNNDGKVSVSEEFGPLKNTDMKVSVDLVNKDHQMIDFYMKKI